MTEPAVLIFGPTASGKTASAVELAKMIGAEIISADSMQVYRYMDIGTAKPSRDEMSGIPHHLIDIKDPDEEWTVSDFVREASSKVKDILGRGKVPLIVGGTGLYINAYINGFSFPIAGKDDELRKRLSELDAVSLHNKLLEIDPAAAVKIAVNDRKRAIRALEVFYMTGKPISQLQKSAPAATGTIRSFCLDMDREELYSRIGSRVDRMMVSGLKNEVSSLLEKGYGKELNSMQALGYKEMAAHLDGRVSLDETVDIIKKRTRNFARRQLIWFRRFKEVEWIPVGSPGDIAKKIASSL